MGKVSSARLLSHLSALLLLSGCAISGGNLNSPSLDGMAPSPSFETSDGRVPASAERYADSSILTTGKTRFSEFIVRQVNDDFGDYAVTKISYPSIDSVSNKGVPKEQLNSALEFYTDFVSTEVLDSISLDNYANYTKWVKEVAPQYVSEEFFDEVVNAQANGEFSGIVFNNFDPSQPSPKNLMPVLLRDGGPRVFNKEIWGIVAEPRGGNIYISSSGQATIMTDDEKALEWDKLVAGPGGETFPRFSDGIPEAANLIFQIGLTLRPETDGWKIVGFSSFYGVDTSQFINDTPENLIEWRNAIR